MDAYTLRDWCVIALFCVPLAWVAVLGFLAGCREPEDDRSAWERRHYHRSRN